MSRTTRKRKAKSTVEASDGPTPEREARGDIVYGDHEQVKERIKSVRTPLHRLFEAGWIDEAQLDAGEKFRRHTHMAGLSGVARTADLSATGGGSERSYGMAVTENQAYHREEYRKAVQAIGAWRSGVFQDFLTHDCPLEEVGYAMGQKNKMQAIAAAREMVISKLVVLVDLWKLKRKTRAA